ncbi:MAG: Heat shock protein DnaJ domain protein [Candidatus Uhrbacteria bacterium GW2011_GWF2_41_430]|nr:MAG: Heat shock protein DnaJ domain protein [Candidatus Uhrbacteria bacterium GW2011_GWF2_41_430]
MFVFVQERKGKFQWYMIENKRIDGKMTQKREYLFTTAIPCMQGKNTAKKIWFELYFVRYYGGESYPLYHYKNDKPCYRFGLSKKEFWDMISKKMTELTGVKMPTDEKVFFNGYDRGYAAGKKERKQKEDDELWKDFSWEDFSGENSAVNDYAILGVQTDASLDAIKKAYRDISKTCHPDVSSNPAINHIFQIATEAYNRLKAKKE